MPCLEEIVENDAKKRARLLDSLNKSFPSSVLSKVLHMSYDENLDPLSSSCTGNNGLENFESKAEIDDELTSLAWLQDANLLKNINPHNKCTSPQPEFDPLNPTNQQNVTYDGVLDRKHKPPYSFSCLIFMAIEASPVKCLPVKGIYDWIVQTFPYFHSAPTGWRNSVRHNLSLNKCFKKVDRDYHLGLGKGSSWCIDPVHRPNLLQALKKTPYHPFQQLQMVSNVTGIIKNIDECSINDVKEVHEKLAFTALSTRKNNCKDANKLHGVKVQQCKRQSVFADVGKIRERIMQDIRLCNDSDDLICTAYPNEDHIYSIPGLVLEETRAAMDSSSVDEGLDSGSSTEQEDGDPVADDMESESSVNLTDKSEKGSISTHKNRTKASGNRSKTAGDHESRQTECVDSDKNDEQKMLYFTSLALLELAAGRQPISTENEVQERSLEKRNISRKRKFEKVHQPRARVSKRGRKVSAALQECTSKNNNEPLITRKSGKRKCKQLLPINSSLWGKRRKLPDNDANLESRPRSSSRKKLTSTRRRKIIRRRRK